MLRQPGSLWRGEPGIHSLHSVCACVSVRLLPHCTKEKGPGRGAGGLARWLQEQEGYVLRVKSHLGGETTGISRMKTGI